MKKIFTLLMFISLSFWGVGQNRDSWTENFDTGLANIYTTGTVTLSTGDWYLNQVYQEISSNSRGGTGHAARINDDIANAHIRTPALNTCGTVTFYYRELNSGGGTFSLEKSYDGSTWTTLTSQSFSGTTFTEFSYDVDDGASTIYIRVVNDNNPGHLIIDDFSVTDYSGGSGNDQTTEVYAPTTQISAGTISSLDDTQSEAVDVFKMTIEDKASGDGLATHVTNIRVKPYTSNTADWTNTIQGVTLNDGSAVTIGTPTITDTYIDIPITSGNLDIADGASKDVTLAVYLNTSNITDGDVLSFFVDADDHGFTADASGSGFVSPFTSGDFNSNDFTVSVTATELQFSGVPSSVTTNSDFSLTVNATDANGNIDTDDATSVTLSLKTGTGTLSSTTGLTQSLSSGTYTWSDLQYNTAESFTIAANGGSFSEVVSSSITASEPEKFYISEVSDPGDDYSGRFVELYNAGTTDIDFNTDTWYLSIQVNGGTFTDVQLSGIAYAGETFVTSYSATNFNTAYGFDSDQNSGFNGSGNDGYFLYKGGDHSTGTLVDAYGVIDEDGTGKAWEYTDSHAVRNSSVTNANSTWTSTEWTITSANVADMTPGTHGDCVTFNGSTDATWSTAGNWVGGTAPSSSKNVKVPSGLTNNPSVDGTASSPSECNNLTIASGASLTIPTGKALTVYGDFSNSGTVTVNSASGSADGSLIVEGTVTGSVDVERYIGYTSWDDTHGWHLISSPVDAQAISDFHTAGSGDDFYKWDEANDIWVNRTDGTGGLNSSFETDFEVGTGYLIALSTAGNKTFSGTINTGDVAKSSLSKTNDGWHLLGNPYPSALQWNNTAWGLTNIDATAQIWNESTASYVNISTGGIIPPMQGFMVHVNDATGGSLTIDASDRTHDATNWYKSGNAGTENRLLLTAVDPAGQTAQQSIILIKPDATNSGFDTKYDSHFLAGFAPQFYSVTDGYKLSTNALPELTEETEIPFEFIKNNSTEFYITVEGIENLNPQENVYLKDLKTGYTQLLNDNPVYEFSSAEGDDPARFVLLFAPVGIEENIALKPFNIYGANNTINIVRANELQGNAVVNVYNVAGQLVKSIDMNGNKKVTVNMDNNRGVYIVSVVAGTEVQTQKVILN